MDGRESGETFTARTSNKNNGGCPVTLYKTNVIVDVP